MKDRTTAYSAGTPRTMDGRPRYPDQVEGSPFKTVARARHPLATERRNVPFPFDPCEPKPRPQTWGNRRRAALRWFSQEQRIPKFLDFCGQVLLWVWTIGISYWIGAVAGPWLMGY